MRLASAIGIVALALTSAACRTAGSYSSGDAALTSKLRELGVEGKSYANDLSQVASIRLGNVYPMGNDLLIEDIHGHLTYIDGATLNPRWEFYGLPRAFDKAPDSTPSAIIGIAGGKVFVISRANGTLESDSRRVNVVPSGAPVANDSTIYVPTFPTPSGNKTVYAISLGSGFVGWGWRTNTDIVGAMVKGGPGAGDEFYFATSDGLLYAFPMYNATEHSPDLGWSTNLHGAVTNDLALEGGDLAVVMSDARLVCVDRVTGAVRWEAFPGSSSERAVGSATFSAKHVFYRCGGELRAFTRDNGTKVWANGEATGFIAERGGRMLLAGPDGMVISVDSKTGKTLGRANLRGWHFPTRSTADATIFAISTRGELVGIELGL